MKNLSFRTEKGADYAAFQEINPIFNLKSPYIQQICLSCNQIHPHPQNICFNQMDIISEGGMKFFSGRTYLIIFLAKYISTIHKFWGGT